MDIHHIFTLFLFLFIPVHQAWIVVILSFEEVLSLTLYLFKINLKPVIDRNSFKMLGKLLAFGIFPMFNLLLNTLNYKVDVVMLKHQTEYAVVSMYGVGVALAEKCWAIPDAIRDILLSKLANGKTAKEVSKVISMLYDSHSNCQYCSKLFMDSKDGNVWCSLGKCYLIQFMWSVFCNILYQENKYKC